MQGISTGGQSNRQIPIYNTKNQIKIDNTSKMDNSQNNTSTHYIPDKNDHNSFAKVIKNLFEKDFTFSDCWYERIITDKVDLWKNISSCRFKNSVFKRDGAFEKYL